MKRFADLAGSTLEEDPEGYWVRWEDVEIAARLCELLDAVPLVTLRFWRATRHIEGFDPALAFIDAVLETRAAAEDES